MSWLTEKSCQACRVDAPRADEFEVREFMGQIPDWRVQGDPSRLFHIVTPDFLAVCIHQADEPCGNGYPFRGLSTPSLTPLTADPGNTGFADAGTEQDALAEYSMHAFPSEDKPSREQETPPAKDQRIRSLRQ